MEPMKNHIRMQGLQKMLFSFNPSIISTNKNENHIKTIPTKLEIGIYL